MEILRTNELEYSYRNKYQIVNALRGVSCGFEKGRIYAVTGPSGCGKTTFLSLLAGLDVPTGGTVEFEGRATSELDRDEYRLGHVSVIYQNFNLFGHLTALENAAYPLYVRGLTAKEAEADASEKLLAVGLTPEQFRRYPNMLSGGEQQRVAIARALAKNPKLMLCDEPTGALDYQTGKQVLKLLQDTCRKTGMTVIIITHNSALAPMADRVVHVKNGTVASVELNAKPMPIEEIEW